MIEKTKGDKPKSRRNTFKFIVAGAALLVLVAIVSSNMIRVDKVIIEPGSAEAVQDKINFGGVQTFSSDGEIKFLTVLVSSGRPTYSEYLIAKYLSDDAQILPWQQVNGDLTDKESEEINRALMKQSQNTAAFVALNTIGCKVEQKGTGAIISEIQEESPAVGSFKVGDVIVSINSVPISLGSQAGTEIRKNSPGDKVDIIIERGKKKKILTKTVTLAESPFEKDSAFLGVGLLTRDLEIDLPVDISIDPGDVSGPSAGLAFTLSIIDQLTQGDLTGGKVVSATGEMGLDGSVGPVGGVPQKVVAAKRAGTQVLLVPKGEGAQAKKRSGNMKVFEVENISQAIDALENSGGEKMRQVQTCPST